MRRSFRIRLAWERLRARRNPGTAMAASSAMIATTIIISTSVKPRRDFELDGIMAPQLSSRYANVSIIDTCRVRPETRSQVGMARLASADYDALATYRYLLRKFLRFSKNFLKRTANLNSEQYEALLA